MKHLAGKTALVTGAASGIGAATAELFAAEGAHVTLADINEDGVQEKAEALGASHRGIRLDVSDPRQWNDLAQSAMCPDILVLNAGILARPAGAPLFDDPLKWVNAENFRRMVDVNIGGVLHGILALSPKMREREGATILAVSSVAGIRAYRPDPIYSMTKHGVIGLCTSLAPTLAEQGTRLVAICPSGIETGMVPPDLHQKRQAEASFAPPSHMAKSILEIWQHAEAGEIWLGRSNDRPRRYVPAPPPEPGAS